MNTKKTRWQNIQKLAQEISETAYEKATSSQEKIQRLYEDYILFKNENDGEIVVENESVEVQKPQELEIKTTPYTHKPTSSSEKIIFSNSKYQPISLNINDKFAFLSQLFNNNSEALENTINALNLTESKETAMLLLKTLKQKHNWAESQQEYIERLEELLEKRFDV